MTSWALIVFALGTKPELVGVYKTESECVRIHDMIKLIGQEGRTPRCFVMVENESLDKDE